MEGKQETIEKKGERPVYRIVQPVMENGEERLLEVGACWKHKSKAGKPYLQARIGSLRLLIFPNEEKPPQKDAIEQILG